MWGLCRIATKNVYLSAYKSFFMKAMIFAAGLGTRLRPLTNDKPKALVKLNGVPLLERVIRKVLKVGFKEIVVNVHHYAEDVIRFLAEKDHFGLKIHISDESDLLLETGGGLKKAASFFDDGKPFLVHNTDIISDIDLKKMYQYHCDSNGLATLAIRQRKTSRYLMFNEKDELAGWVNTKTGQRKISRTGASRVTLKAFSGIQIIDPALFSFFPDEKVFSIIDVYLKAASSNTIMAYAHDDGQWLDVGKPEQLKLAEQFVED